jgi:hypothetical protein
MAGIDARSQQRKRARVYAVKPGKGESAGAGDGSESSMARAIEFSMEKWIKMSGFQSALRLYPAL